MIYFDTSISKSLHDGFVAGVKAGHITTWKDAGHGYFTHDADRWRGKAIISFTAEPKKLKVNLTPVTGNCADNEKTAVFAYYQGHLAETFMNHFAGAFSQSVLSAAPVYGDTGFV